MDEEHSDPSAAPPAWRARLHQDFDALAERSRPALYRVIHRITGNPERSEELVQDALLTAFRKLDGYEGRASFSTWLCGIGKHLALNDVRRHSELLTEDGVLDAQDDGVNALRGLRRSEREEFVRQAAADLLDEHEQEVVYLRYAELMPRAQIASLLGMESEDQVRVVLQRCRRRLEKGMRLRLQQLDQGTSFVRSSW
jgi:RNA polymerase sigma-70 factor (ECF subfamily)